MKKGNFRKPIVNYHEMLQTSNSIDCVSYEACIHVRYIIREEMLKNIDNDIEILYPIFCRLFYNVDNMESDQILKEKFKQKIFDALDLIMQNMGQTYVFKQQNLEVIPEDPEPYQAFLFYLKKLEYYQGEILNKLISKSNTEAWVHVLNKLASLDNRSSSQKWIISKKLIWENMGIDGWEELEKQEKIKNPDFSVNAYDEYSITKIEKEALAEIGKQLGKHIFGLRKSIGFVSNDYGEYDYLEGQPSFVYENNHVIELNLYSYLSNPLPVGKLGYLKSAFFTGKNLRDDYEGIHNFKYLIKKYNYSIRSYDTLMDKIKKGINLDGYDISLPNLEDYRVRLLEECKKNPIGENSKNIKKLQGYYYQGYKLQKEAYLVLNELNKLLDLQIPAWSSFSFEEKKYEYGVVISKETISILILRSRRLSTFPESITKLKSLYLLVLNGAGISALPESIGNLEHLDTLDLSNNNLSSLPKSFKKLTKLKNLDLKNNEFTSYPFEIISFKELWYIHEVFKGNPIENPYNFEGDDSYDPFFMHVQQQFEIQEWTIEQLIEKIERNEKLNDGDLLAPNLLDYEKKIVEICKKYAKNSTTTEMLQMLKERRVLNEIEEFIGRKLGLISYGDMDNSTGYKIRNQHIEVLSVIGEKLEKLSTSIGDLINLRFLILSDNILENLPLSISNLKDLEYIDIKNNKFSELPFIFIDYKTEIGYEGNPWNEESLLYIEHWKEDYFKKFLGEQEDNWKLEELLKKIENNKSLSVIDRFHANLCMFKNKILEKCAKTKTKTAYKMINLLEERDCKNKGKKDLKIKKYQGYELPIEEYLAIIELNKLINAQIPVLSWKDIRSVDFGIEIYNGTAQALKLKKTGLVSFPESITQLKNIKTLVLSDNKISNLPKSFKNLTKLRNLALENNEFTSYPFELLSIRKTLYEDEMDYCFWGNPIEKPFEFKQGEKNYFFDYLEKLYQIRNSSLKEVK